MKSLLSSSTAHALLGLLSIRSMSGYDIRQFIPETIGHFWNESYGQIYPALRQMTEEGLVEKRTEAQAGRPDRHVYSLTEAGRERLREWLKLPFAWEVGRNELLLKMFFGAHVPASVNREHMLVFLEAQERRLKVFDGIVEALGRERMVDSQLPFWLITLSRGRHEARAGIAWARETLAVLDGLEDGDGVGSAGEAGLEDSGGGADGLRFGGGR